jgi:serine/threonine protein kinase/Flp pilus assembly protein TadD
MKTTSEAEDASAERLMGQVVEEFLDRLAAGEQPDVESYAGRHPQLADVLRQMLPALQLMRVPGGDLVEAGEEPSDLTGCLGDFRILREVGRGGMGVVYEAEQISLSRRVALKVLPFAGTLDPRQLQRFKNEAQAAAGLQHQHIVPVYFVGCERGVHFYAMQFIDGQTLATLIAELRQTSGSKPPTEAEATGPYTPCPGGDTAAVATLSTERSTRSPAYFRSVAELGRQAAEALEHAHQLGVIHRDVKPANLMLDGRGNLWITDFGLAHCQSQASLTMTGDLVGTLRYMSPEQALGKRVIVDQRTDVYSLGATLYELMTLEPVFAGQDRQELLRQIAFDEPRPPRRLNKGIPAELVTIVLKALEKNPAERYATAQELADDLQRWLKDEPIRARRPSLVLRARKWARRHQAVVGAAAVCLLVIFTALGGSFGWVVRDRADRDRQLRTDVERVVQDAARQLDAGNWLSAKQTLVWAESLLPAGLDAARLRQQIADLGAEVNLAARLEEIRTDIPLDRASFDSRATVARYVQAFREHGIDVDALPRDEAAAAIRRMRIRRELIAALDDWAQARRAIGDSDWKRPLRIAAAVHRGDDPWWDRLRHTLEEDKAQGVLELGSEAEHQDLSPGAVTLLAGAVNGMCKTSQKAASGRSAADMVVALLAKAQQGHPDDFWINVMLGYHLLVSRPPRLEEAIRYYSVALALRPNSLAARGNLGVAFFDQGNYDQALVHLLKVKELAPHLAKVRWNLGQALRLKGRWDEAIREYREAVRLGSTNPEAHYSLAKALADRGQLAEAEAEYREIIRRNPAEYRARADLSVLLEKRGQWREAEEQLRRALDTKPDSAGLHRHLGTRLRLQKRFREAEHELREAVRLDPKDGEAHNHLGGALRDQGRLHEAVVAFRAASRLMPQDPGPHINLGTTLMDLGQYSEAEVETRKALHLDPHLAYAHYNLGLVYQLQKKGSAAVPAYREAIRLNPAYAEAHCNLGLVLLEQGRFAEALAALKRGHELGLKRNHWPCPSDEWVRQAQKLVDLEARLPKILSGEAQPTDSGERIELAQLCRRHKKQYTAAARFYAAAFADQPERADDLVASHRYYAACAAALAATGQGEDAGKLDDKERARLRGQTLDWLRADLMRWRKQGEGKDARARAVVRQVMQHWLRDSDLAGVRDPAGQAKLPEAERQQWQKLWGEVKDLLSRTAAESPGPQK